MNLSLSLDLLGSLLIVNWSPLSVSQNWDSALPDVGLGVCCGKFTAVKSEPAPAWPTVFWDVLHGAGQRHVTRREPSVSRCSCSGKQGGKATLFPLKKGHSETVRLSPWSRCFGSFLRGVSQDGRLTAPWFWTRRGVFKDNKEASVDGSRCCLCAPGLFDPSLHRWVVLWWAAPRCFSTGCCLFNDREAKTVATCGRTLAPSLRGLGWKFQPWTVVVSASSHWVTNTHLTASYALKGTKAPEFAGFVLLLGHLFY